MNTTPQKIGVCGAGTMGSGIAQTCAAHGYHVILFDLSASTLESAEKKIAAGVQLLVAKKKIGADNGILEKIQFTTSVKDCVADLIIEAVVEKADVKASLFNQLTEANGPSTIYATNTSSLAVSDIAKQLPDPSRFAGMHFFNPATLMKLVEVVKTTSSSENTINTIVSFAKSIGKIPVLCKDAPGFIVNHVARPYYLEALHLAENYSVDFATTDLLMEVTGFKMGPFRLMDLIGNDINYSVSCIVYDALGRPERLRPSAIQKEKVDSGQLGRKTGRGYYEYQQ